MYTKNKIRVNNADVEYWKVNHDVNGNPRYVIHFLSIAMKYDDALDKIRNVGGQAYRAKWFGGGLVFSTYNLSDTLKRLTTK